jgi:hypothetical protein
MRAGAVCIALGSLCYLLILPGCGGGSAGSNTLPPPVGQSTSTATPSPSPTPAGSPSPYPHTDGDTFVYAGTLTQTFQNFPEVQAPGTPSPEPTSVTTQNVTQTISVRSNQSFNGGSGLFDLHSAETDAYTSGLKTTTSTTDTYEAIAQVGSASQLVSYGSQYADEAGDTVTTSYSPQTVLDQLPDTPGAQWSNSPAATVLEALAGNSNGSAITVQRTVHADGTYSETTTYPPGYAAPGYTGTGNIQENTDGSGTFAFVANGSALTLEYSVPVPQPTGAPLITVAEFLGLDPTPANQPYASFQLAAWYGSAPAFYGETDRDLGVVPIPASCGLKSQFPQQASAIAQTIDRTDTVLGYTEHETVTSYVANGYGTLCTVLSDTQTLYYDFNGDQAFVFTLAPPLEIASVSETLSLQPSSSIITAQARTTSVAASAGPSLEFGAALRGSFDHAVATQRHNLTRALVRATQRLQLHGGAR